jgi:transposase
MNIRMPTRADIHTAFEQGEAAVVELLIGVERQLEEWAGQLEKQTAALQDLPARLEKNSRNSSKPPSSDGYSKPGRTASLRKPGQKPTGGQPGHAGYTLKLAAHPEHTEVHVVATCEQWGACLHAVAVTAHAERQVVDLPAMRIAVTAHRAASKRCPGCGAENRGALPAGGTGPVQYGNGVKPWAAYFPSEHCVPVERTAQIFADLVPHRLSAATILQVGKALSQGVEPAMAAVQAHLRAAEVLPTDASGVRVNGSLHWLHVAAPARCTP